MNWEVVMDFSEDEMKDFYYTAVRMTTKIDYRVVREFSDLGIISSHRDMYELARMTEKSSVTQASVIRA